MSQLDIKKRRKTYTMRLEAGLPDLARNLGIDVQLTIERALREAVRAANKIISGSHG